jgi:hypothetical protein
MVSCASLKTLKAPGKEAVVLSGEGRSRLELAGKHYVCRFESLFDKGSEQWRLTLMIPFSGEIVWIFDPKNPDQAIAQINRLFVEQGFSQTLNAKTLVDDLIDFLAWKKNKKNQLEEEWIQDKGQWILRSRNSRTPITKIYMHKFNHRFFERLTIEAWGKEPTSKGIPELRLEIFYTNFNE